jgi:hypothetical protein
LPPLNSMSEFEKHTVVIHEQVLGEKIQRLRIINIYDPQLMFTDTPESDDKLIFQTAARHPSGVYMVYSFTRENPSKEIQILALSNGTRKEKEEIVNDFDHVLRTNSKVKKPKHISRPIICEDDVFKWIIHFE